MAALLLPIPRPAWVHAVDEAKNALAATGIGEDADQAAWINGEAMAWRVEGVPSRTLATLLRHAIDAGGDAGSKIGAKYVYIHGELIARDAFTHDEATAFLADAHLAIYLATTEQMSSARIASVLTARNQAAAADWRNVQGLLAGIDEKPGVSLSQAQVLNTRDVEEEQALLADADLATAIAIVTDHAEALGLDEDLGAALHALLGEARVGPYLQMLHFICIVAEYWDHELSQPYEFAPRGEVGKWVCDMYPASLAPAGNAFLNNAKSADRIGREWASTKKTREKRAAVALVEVIESLNWLGFAARRQVARWIRLLLARTIRIASDVSPTVLDDLDTVSATRLAAAIGAAPTTSRGIIEQRIVDVIATGECPPSDFVARGVGDPVNASNISRRKLGDCDFVRAADGTVVAFEAHAGRLSNAYIEEHLRSFANVLPLRLAEWDENFGPERTWHVCVRFVAHDVEQVNLAAISLPSTDARVELALETVTFADLLDENSLTAAFVNRANQLFLAPIRDERTPDGVRVQVREIAFDENEACPI